MRPISQYFLIFSITPPPLRPSPLILILILLYLYSSITRARGKKGQIRTYFTYFNK
ncbi:MAG: hypothetical protein MRERV_74c009 [Mycoplasmataceae bacterium RV_VA103A]|nr:MAG: hypothetical protein MRERV_74c009 [Mycoplasmataceae bacterium RV_VA103A]